jgi:hypothetical protein
MKYDYKSPEQLEAERPKLQEGLAQFEITKSEDAVSKTSGNPMISLQFKVWDVNGKTGVVFDYITSAQSYKIKALCYAIGKPEWYAMDYDLQAHELVGFAGKCMLKNEASTNPAYSDKMKIHYYVEKEESSTLVPPHAQENEPFIDDDISF